jgi:hypothetical protein
MGDRLVFVSILLRLEGHAARRGICYVGEGGGDGRQNVRMAIGER